MVHWERDHRGLRLDNSLLSIQNGNAGGSNGIYSTQTNYNAREGKNGNFNTTGVTANPINRQKLASAMGIANQNFEDTNITLFPLDNALGKGATASVYPCTHKKLGCLREVHRQGDDGPT